MWIITSHVAFCNKADSSRKPAMEGASLRSARCLVRQFQAIQELLSSGGPALGVVDGGQNFFANINDFVDPLAEDDTPLQGGDRDDAAPQGQGSCARRRCASLTPGPRGAAVQQAAAVEY